MDNIVIWAENKEVHEDRRKAVRDRIKKYVLLMNWEKCLIKV